VGAAKAGWTSIIPAKARQGKVMRRILESS
jgi:hypothetical protein